MAKKPADTAEKEDDRDEFLDGIGERIKLARIKAKLTQKELADLLKTNQSWIYMAEDGQQNLQLGSLRKIAKTLGISVSELILGSQGPTSNIEVPPEIIETFRKLVLQIVDFTLKVAADKQLGSAASNEDPPNPDKPNR